MKKIIRKMELHSIQKKILLVSKLSGVSLGILFIIAIKSPGDNIALYALLLVIVAIILTMDHCLKCFITKPLLEINEVTGKIANLDFSELCNVSSKDEYGVLANNINKMAINLQKVLREVEATNIQLEEDVHQKECLLAERKELVDNLSHEMKTPIGIIRAYAEGMENNENPVIKEKYTRIIIEETERMNKLISTLIDLSSLESGAYTLRKERFEFIEFVETIAGRLLLDIPNSNYIFQYVLPENKIYVETDKSRMEQVVENLLLNARKNVKETGILKLTVEEAKEEITFRIFNQGKCIPEDVIGKIWNKFYRTSETEYEGTGLGLAIVAQVLNMQGYKYGVSNKKDGVEFYFSLPKVL